MPAGFQLVGQWRQQENAAKILEFKSDNTAINPSGVALKWEFRQGVHFIIWEGDTLDKIEILGADKIKIGETVLLSIAPDTEV